MAELLRITWLNTKDEETTSHITISNRYPIHVYEEYEKPTDLVTSVYISHPAIPTPLKLVNTDLDSIKTYIEQSLIREQKNECNKT